MSAKNPIVPPTTKSIASYVKKHAAEAKKTQGHRMKMAESVREADYDGHHIVIRTTYQITVDGKPVTGHMDVGNDGRVHYHPVPNMSFASAVDLVKQLIDVFPDDFADGAPAPSGGHMHMAMPRAKTASPRLRAKKTKSGGKK